MKKIQFKFLFTLILTFSFFKITQSQSHDFIISKLTIKDGLPSNIIWNVEWSKSDNIWLSTQAGLIEYNGNKIIKTKYNHQFIDIQKDANLNLFALDQFGDIYKIQDDQSPHVYKYFSNDAVPRNYFYNYSPYFLEKSIFNQIKRDPNLSFGWFNHKVHQLNQTKFIKELHDNKGLNEYELYEIDGKNIYKKSTLQCQKEECLFILNNKFFLITNKQEVFELNEKFEYIKNLGNISVSNFKEIKWMQRNQQKQLCFIDGDKVMSLSIINNQIQVEQIALLITDEIIKSIAYNGKLQTCIVATEANGIYIYKKKKINILKPINQTKTKSLYIQIPISQSQLLTTARGIVGEGNIKSLKNIKTTLDKNWTEDWNHRIWYSGEDRISYFERGKLRSTEFYYYKNQGSWTFYCDKRNKIIYLYNSSGFYTIDSNYKIQCIYRLNGKFDPNNQGNEIKLYNEKLYVSTNRGLLVFNLKRGKIENFFCEGDFIRGITKYKDGIILCSYQKQLIFIKDKGKVNRIMLDDLQYLKFAHSIYIDSSNHVWISTNNGIIYGSSQLLDAMIQGRDFKKYLHYINYQNGLEEVELNGGGNSSIIQFNNRLSFLSTNGIVQLDPKDWEVDSEDYNYNLKFTNDDQKEIQQNGNQIKLDHTNEFCVIEIISTNWNNSSDNRYQYYWEGKWHWLKSEDEQKITLKTKDHGVFPFVIVKYCGDGNKQIIQKINIEIALKWSETWWGIGLMVVFLGLIIFIIIKIRLRRIRKINYELNETVKLQTQELLEINKELELRNEKKSQIIAILGHDLFVPLKFLSQTGNAMIKNYGSMTPEEIIDALTSISNTSNRLSLLCKNILNWIQYEKNELELSNQKFELNEVIDQMIQIISLATKQKGNKIIKSMPEKTIVNTNLDALGIVILNLVNNANRFSENGQIFVSCHEDKNNQLIISIKDEGIGMSEEMRETLLKSGSSITQPDTDYQKSSGIGYYIIHEILKSVNGNIQISESGNIGTEIIITWPLN